MSIPDFDFRISWERKFSHFLFLSLKTFHAQCSSIPEPLEVLALFRLTMGFDEHPDK
jgi:hypothetical protein